jgi:hypothetical protein
MQGPPLTHDEVVGLLARDVRKLTSLGVPYRRATAEAARRRGIKQSQLERLIERQPVVSDQEPLTAPTSRQVNAGAGAVVNAPLAGSLRT